MKISAAALRVKGGIIADNWQKELQSFWALFIPSIFFILVYSQSSITAGSVFIGRKNVFTTEDAGVRRETPILWAFRAFSLRTSAYSVVETFSGLISNLQKTF